MGVPSEEMTDQLGGIPSRLRLFAVIYLMLLLFQLSAGYLLYRSEWQQRSALLSSRMSNLITLEEGKMRHALEQICFDIVFLGEIIQDYYFSREEDQGGMLREVIRALGASGFRYDQIRILNPKGFELFRLNYDNNQKMTFVPPEELQDKSDRFYFRDIQKGIDDTIYLFNLDLNVEHGSVEIPYQPVIRAGLRLRDPEGQENGYLVLNHRSELILSNLSEYKNVLEFPFSVFFLNSRGYWLLGPDHDKEWGFMFPSGKEYTLKEENPSLWEKISSSPGGQVWDQGNLYVFQPVIFSLILSSIEPLLSDSKGIKISDRHNPYYLVYRMPREVFSRLKKDILNQWLPQFLILHLLLIGLGYSLTELIIRSREYRKRLLRFANVDDLTGCLNRRSGLQVMEQFLSLERRRGEIMTIAYTDINSLKYVNDRYGHEEGDRYILMMVDLIRNHLRTGDSLVRMGGDEFLIILPDCSISQAEQIRQRIREQEERINLAGSFPYPVSFSWGAFEISPDQMYTMMDIIATADSRMYKEKRSYYKESPLYRRED